MKLYDHFYTELVVRFAEIKDVGGGGTQIVSNYFMKHGEM